MAKKQNPQDELWSLLADALSEANDNLNDKGPKVFNGQRPHEANYGISPKNPLCSASLASTDAYLSRLRTVDGKKFTWQRVGSVRADCNGATDIGMDKYQLYLDGKPYKVLYFVPYVGESTAAPSGMRLIDGKGEYNEEISNSATTPSSATMPTREIDLSDQSLLLHAIDANLYTSEERRLVAEYRQKYQELLDLEGEERILISRSSYSKLSFFESRRLKGLPEKIRVCKNYLLLEESSPKLMGVLEREKARTIKLLDMQYQKNIEANKHRIIKDLQESGSKYDILLSKAIPTREIRKEILSALDAHDNNLSRIGKLAVATIMAVMKIQEQNKLSYVCRSNLASCDTVIFSAFLVRALALSDVSNTSVAEHFTNEFLFHISSAICKLFPVNGIATDTILNNRMMFYDRIFLSKQGMENRIQTITCILRRPTAAGAVTNGS